MRSQRTENTTSAGVLNKKNKNKNKAIVKPRSILKPKPLERVEMGQVLLCKMRGYCMWPGFVTGFDKNLVIIEFFGDNTTYRAAINNFFSFEDSHDIIINNLRTKKTQIYAKAITEAEYVLGIPAEKSIFNQINN